MATRTLKQEKVTLADESEVTVRSVPINRLRKVMAEVRNLNDAEDEVQALDITLRAGLIIFDHLNADRVKGENDDERLEAFGDLVDMPALEQIIEVGAGVKLSNDDPNPMPATA